MELRQLLRLLWHRRALMAGVFLSVFGALVLLALLCETQYVATAKVYLYHSTTKASLLSRVTLDSTMMSSASLTDTERATYEELAATVPVVRPVIEELRLHRKRKSLQLLEFIPFVRAVIDHFWPHFGLRPMTYEELTNKSLVHLIFPRPYLKAAMVEDADILEFSSSADSLDLAMRLANDAADSFVSRETAMRQDECRAVAEATARELPRARDSYKKALETQRKTRQAEKIVDLSSEGEQLVSRYYTLSADRDANRLSLVRVQGMLANVKAQLAKRPEFRKSSEVTQRSSLIDSVKLTLRDLYMDLAAAKVRMTAEHPAVKEIENKIAEAKRIIRGEARKVYGSETVSTDPTFSYLSERAADYAAQVAGYESQDAAFAALLEGVERKADAFPGRAAASALVSARVEATQAFLSNLNQLESSALAGTGMDLSIAHVVAPAERPGKIDDYMRPKLSLFLAAGLVVGAFLAVVAALVAAWTDASIGAGTWLGETGVRVLGVVPRKPGVPRAQAVRRVREALVGPGAGGDVPAGRGRVLVFAGVDDAGDETAGFVRELAGVLARPDRTTLLVDADLRQPRLAALADLPVGPGLAEVLAGAVALEAVLVPGPELGLSVLPAGLGVDDGQADRLLDGPGLGPLLAELAGRFDLVLVCAAPYARSGDAVALARSADALTFVARAYRDHAAVVAEAVQVCLAATGHAPLAVIAGGPADEPTPREVWTDLRARLTRRTV